VAVVGSGLAATVAALDLRERGLSVVQLAGRPGATAMTGGAFDVAAASPGVPELPWRDPLRGEPLDSRERLGLLLADPSRHPYALLFGTGQGAAERAVSELARGVGRLAEWLAPSGLVLEGSLVANRLLASTSGTLHVADFAFGPAAAGDLLTCQEIAIVDVPGLEGFSPAAMLRTLGAELAALGVADRPVRVVRPDWPAGLCPGGPAARSAARWQEPGAAGPLEKALAPHASQGRLLLFPQVLGIDRSAELCRALAEGCGCAVAEALAQPPHSLAGYRLDRALRAAARASGAEIQEARVARVVLPALREPIRLELEGGAGLSVDGLLLATGRFAAGGLRAEAAAVREPLLGLPLRDADGRRVDGIPARRSVRKGYANPQPLYAAGVGADARLRPLEADGSPACDRLFAAGDLLGGFDPARERTGLGVAMATGLRAAGGLAAALAEAGAA
jgi:glycerol-3-phosphate dehydrogenase subunit B